MARDRIIRKRKRLARRLERATVPARPFMGRGPRYLVQPSVTNACAPSLHAIAEALRDETHAIDEPSLNAVRSFLTEGGSPFFGRDVTAALREVVRLQHVIVGTESAAFGGEQGRGRHVIHPPPSTRLEPESPFPWALQLRGKQTRTKGL